MRGGCPAGAGETCATEKGCAARGESRLRGLDAASVVGDGVTSATTGWPGEEPELGGDITACTGHVHPSSAVRLTN